MLRILHDTKYDFIKHWKTAVGATIAFIVLGFGLMGYHKARTGAAINYSIEFTGGTVVQLKFAQPAQADAVRSAVDAAGFTGSEIASFGSPADYLIKVPPKAGATSAPDAPATGQQIVAQLAKTIPGNPARVERAESVGPRVGAELKTKALTAILISFLVTLMAGIVASLFTSIFVVRTFYLMWLNRTRGAQTLSI